MYLWVCATSLHENLYIKTGILVTTHRMLTHPLLQILSVYLRFPLNTLKIIHTEVQLFIHTLIYNDQKRIGSFRVSCKVNVSGTLQT